MCRMQIKGVSPMRRVKIVAVLLNLSTLRSVCIFSILFFTHFLWCWQGEFNSQGACFVSGLFLYTGNRSRRQSLRVDGLTFHLPTSRNDNRVLSLSFEKMFLPEDEYANIEIDITYKLNLATFHH